MNKLIRYEGEPIGFRITGTIDQGMQLLAKIRKTRLADSINCTVSPQTGYWDITVPGGDDLPAGEYNVAVLIKQGDVTVTASSFVLSIIEQP